ncbi:hypothetical protein [Thalassospira marina]|nr:hypothetical protein [Thalassospira marina]
MKGGRYEKDSKTGKLKRVEQMGNKPDPKPVKAPKPGDTTGKDKE